MSCLDYYNNLLACLSDSTVYSHYNSQSEYFKTDHVTSQKNLHSLFRIKYKSE